VASINWRTSLRIASGSCSPMEPAKVYDGSKPFGPSSRISQFSLARDPAIDTRPSPRRSANACSMCAVISLHSCASPRFCSSIDTPIPLHFIVQSNAYPWCKPEVSQPHIRLEISEGAHARSEDSDFDESAAESLEVMYPCIPASVDNDVQDACVCPSCLALTSRCEQTSASTRDDRAKRVDGSHANIDARPYRRRSATEQQPLWPERVDLQNRGRDSTTRLSPQRPARRNCILLCMTLSQAMTLIRKNPATVGTRISPLRT
jgi:hypothetical protein